MKLLNRKEIDNDIIWVTKGVIFINSNLEVPDKIRVLNNYFPNNQWIDYEIQSKSTWAQSAEEELKIRFVNLMEDVYFNTGFILYSSKES